MERKNGNSASEAGALRQTVVGTEAGVTALGRKTSIPDKTERMGLNPGPPGWAPRWAVEMHPLMQLGASIGLYFFHMVSGLGEVGYMYRLLGCHPCLYNAMRNDVL